MPTKEALAGKIDHTLLKADALPEQIEVLCREAAELKTASVCVNPLFVPLCRDLLRGTGVLVCTVAGFPLGASAPQVKAFEAAMAVRDGADEIDMVISVGLMKKRRLDEVRADIAGVVSAAAGKTVKVILETCLLTPEETALACKLCEEAGAHFVKTSTGFSAAGASEENVRLMRESCSLRVKAAGGIRTTGQALAMLDAGADRLGCSATAEILMGLEREM